MTLSEQTRLAAKEIVARYPRGRSALGPMLHLVQSEEGYVSPEGIAFCAEALGLSKAEVGAVATFYTMYKRRPTGEYLVSVCTNTLCDVVGGAEIYQTLSESLGVGHDETTPDGQITLEHAECLAACDYAPVVTVNYEFFDQQTPESASSLVAELQAGGRPMPTRGAPLCTFREISRQLAGFIDEREGALDAGPALEPTLVGNRLAVQRGETAPPYGEPVPLDRPTDGDRPAPTQAGTAPAGTAPAGTAPAGTAPAGTAPAGTAPAPAAAGSASGEREGGPVATPQTEAEKSAEAGTARYGGPPGEASSGGGEGGDGVETSASDPASSPGSGVTHESDAGKADEPTSTSPAQGGPGTVGSDSVAPTSDSPPSTAADAATGEAEPERRPTNRARKTRREG